MLSCQRRWVDLPTALELIDSSHLRLKAAELFYGHGTDNAADDALFLVLHGLGLDYDATDEILNRPCDEDRIARVEALVSRRIEERLPSAYLTQRMWFAGLEFYVDERVLVPRSPLAELILGGFAPWAEQINVKRILEIGTGSGCIAIALAEQFPKAEIIATDISPAALEVARINHARHLPITAQLEFIEANLFPEGLGSFDLIVTNPPYVPDSYMDGLPEEYHAEPKMALTAGKDGLTFIHDIFKQAASRMNPGGLLFFDVGDRWHLIEQTYRDTAFTWCELARGGEGIGMLERSALSKLGQTQVK